MSKKGNAIELGTKPIGKLLMQYAIPAIIAMTATSLYNMVDSIFIGQGVGPMAISGLAITFPFMNLGAAFGAMVGVGASTLISVKLGQRDYSMAQTVLGNVVTLNVIIGVVFSIVSLLFLDPILYFFGASSDTIGYARDFMQVILLGNIFTHMYLGLNAVIRASGHPQKAMYATINTVIINTVLDPIFIYGFDWGIRGAAIATIIAQVISLIWQLNSLVVGFMIKSKAHQILSSPAFPYQLQQTLFQYVFKSCLTIRHSHSVAHFIQLQRTIFPVTGFCLCFHQEGISIAEQYNIVIGLSSVGMRGAIHLIFCHSCTGCFNIGASCKI